jgi:hypothetical protein
MNESDIGRQRTRSTVGIHSSFVALLPREQDGLPFNALPKFISKDYYGDYMLQRNCRAIRTRNNTQASPAGIAK